MYNFNEIKSNTAALSWRYISGHLNPADDATITVKCKDLRHDVRWTNDHRFLKQDVFEWCGKTEALYNVIFSQNEKNLHITAKLHHLQNKSIFGTNIKDKKHLHLVTVVIDLIDFELN